MHRHWEEILEKDVDKYMFSNFDNDLKTNFLESGVEAKSAAAPPIPYLIVATGRTHAKEPIQTNLNNK